MAHWIQTYDGSFTLLNSDINEMYHSKHGAWSECQHVFVDPFLEHAKLHPRPTWRILDLGFGLGLNWLCVVDAWLATPHPAPNLGVGPLPGGERGVLIITSIERDPAILDVQVSREQLGQFPVSDEALQLLQHYKMYKKVDCLRVQAKLLLGGAVDIMNRHGQCGLYDVIFHDAFSPTKNPECWTREFFGSMSRCVAEGALLMTYSVAASVKKALKDSGFEIKKRPGFGGKRECLVAVFKGHKRLEK